jgi:putative DNA primase/helicase
VGDPEEPRAIRLTEEFYSAIRSAVRHTDAKLIVADALKDFSGIDNDVQEMQVRQFLSPLQRLIGELGIAFVGVAHTPKKGGSRAADESVIGSVAWRDVVRSALICGYLTEDKIDGPRAVAPAKANYCRLTPPIEFRLVDSNGAARVEWLGERADVHADDLNPAFQSSEDRTARDEARDFLLTVLSEGPAESEKLMKQGRALGISDRTLMRARRELNVEAYREGGRAGCWWLRIPEGQLKDARNCDVAAFEWKTGVTDDPATTFKGCQPPRKLALFQPDTDRAEGF